MSNVHAAALEFDYAVVNLATDTTTVKDGQVAVRGIFINTVMSAHTCVIQDGTTPVFTIPASTAAGVWIPLGDTHFKTSLIVNPDDLGTGNITIIYKPAIG